MKKKFIASLPFLVGGCAGIGVNVIARKTDIGDTELISGLLLLAVMLYVISFIHIIVHEAGHLVAGKISGYTFVSFRIGRWMLMRKDNKWVLKQYVIPGTGGQCLLKLPVGDAYEFPYLLYNAGGVIANLLLSFIGILIYVLIPTTGWFKVGMFLLIGTGLFFAIMNGIPMKVSGMPNDGYNIRLLSKNRMTRYAFWLQLEINDWLTSGKKLEDMPPSYFEIPDDADLNDAIIGGIIFYKCNYLHSKGQFEEAKALSEQLIHNVPGLVKVYKQELECELLFYEIIGPCRAEEINKLYTKDLQRYIQMTLTYITRKRLMYAYELFVNQNEEAAAKQKEAFWKIAKNYPYTGEIESESSLLELIQEKYKSSLKIEALEMDEKR